MDEKLANEVMQLATTLKHMGDVSTDIDSILEARSLGDTDKLQLLKNEYEQRLNELSDSVNGIN